MKSIWLILLLVSMSGNSHSAVPVPNPSFEVGEQKPTGWTLSGGEGAWLEKQAFEGRRSIAVTGAGEDSNYWRSDPLPLEPGEVYRLRFQVRKLDPGAGIAITGPVFCNRDIYSPARDWQTHSSIFVVPENTRKEDMWLRFGQWHLTGSVAFDQVELSRAQPMYVRQGEFVLGEGESISGNIYRFQAPFFTESRNQSRPLFDARCNFNSNRWVFGKGSELIYRHEIGDREQKNGEVKVAVNYYTGGRLVVEASGDGESWIVLGKIEGQTGGAYALPSDIFPAREVFVRLRMEAKEPVGPDSDPGALQINSYEYMATLSGEPVDLTGKTRFADVVSLDPRFEVTIEDLGDLVPGGKNEIVARVTNRTENPITVETGYGERGGKEGPQVLDFSFDGDRRRPDPSWAFYAVSREITIQPGEQEIRMGYGVSTTGHRELEFFVGGFRALIPLYVSEIFNVSYGEKLPGSDERAGLWWCSSGWKVSRIRPMPDREGKAIVIRAAKNEAEAAQLVLRPTEEISLVKPSVSSLEGPEGAVIPAENVDILRVRYVDVARPTDHTGAVAPWPDPLPPFQGPIDLEADQNQPIWIRVKVPREVPAGRYRGTIGLKLGTAELEYQGDTDPDFGATYTFLSDWKESEVPLEVEVFDFELPDRMTCVTAFGFSPANVWNYHKLTHPVQQRLVLHKYLASYSAHHIAPYDPAPLDRFEVTWPEVTKQTKPEDLVPTFNWAAWDASMEKAIDRFHFNSFRIPIQGMGGGSFHSRREPELLGFTEDTEEYKAAFQAYCHAVESHLREKGWLDEAFVYWFDEPEPRDYEFVMNGFRKLKEAAPDINRMLTEQVEEELIGGPNIWCPVSPRYEHEPAMERKQAGEKIWWYVCTGPKAPFCTLFIDHPATELRVWLWQTWQRKIDGILIWQATYWTSGAAYPDSLQNPYQDPMGWVSSYGTERGVRRPWGNGDGRFIYPPEAAADGTQDEPVLDGPVDSIRWEMLRDGIEDYEYMVILRRLLKEKRMRLPADDYKRYEKLLDVPSNVTTDMTGFTNDPAPIEKRRHEIARAIETLLEP